MDWPGQCAAVIPCLDEARTIGGVVQALRPFLPTVIVVDDGSADDTSARAAAAGAIVVRHAGNCGKGAALDTGWREAHRRGFAWALSLDGDAQHDPGDIPVLLVCGAASGADLIVGDRFSANGHAGLPWVRRATNRWLSRRLSARAGRRLPDTQCGFRLLRLALWERLRLQTRHFEIESELLLAALAHGARVEFAPVRALPPVHGSHIHPVIDGWRWWRWWQDAPRFAPPA